MFQLSSSLVVGQLVPSAISNAHCVFVLAQGVALSLGMSIAMMVT